MLSSHGFNLVRCRNHTASIPSVAVRGRLQMGIGAACCRPWCPFPTPGHFGRFFARVLLYMLLGWIVVGVHRALFKSGSLTFSCLSDCRRVCIKMSESFALVPAGRSFFFVCSRAASRSAICKQAYMALAQSAP